MQRGLSHSPFSPQSQPAQSPIDQSGFPESPDINTYNRSISEPNTSNDYMLHSPQTPKAFGHQSPNATPNRSPAYAGQQQQTILPIQNQQNVIRSNMDVGGGGYASAPGTPRPNSFGTSTVRPTVYARTPDIFTSPQSSPFTSPRAEQFQQQQQQQQSQPQDGNRQLRDLLQRQQMSTSNPGIVQHQLQQQQQSATQQSPRWGPENIVDDNSQQQSQQQQQQNPDAITFRQPLPPGMISRPQRLPLGTSGGSIIRTNLTQQQQQQPNPRGIIMTSDIKHRMIRPPLNLGNQQLINQHQHHVLQQQQQQQQHHQQFVLSSQRMPGNASFNQITQQHDPSQQTATALLAQRLVRNDSKPDESGSGEQETESNEIPDNVTAELEKLEQENNAIGEVEGVGDILGGLGEDDDELLDSLTADMGVDFNILEYADPELDTLNDGEKNNILDSLELDDGEPEKDDKKLMDINPTVPSSDNRKLNEVGQIQMNQNIINNPQISQQQNMSVQQQQQQQQFVQNQQRQILLSQNNQQQQIIGSGQQQQQQQQQIGVGQPHLILNSGNLNPQQQAQHINRIKLQQGGQQAPITLSNLQQIQQQMQQHVQQNHLAVGSQLVNKESGIVGIVTANNNVSFTYPGLVNRG